MGRLIIIIVLIKCWEGKRLGYIYLDKDWGSDLFIY